MEAVWSTYGDVIVAFVAALPCAAVAVWALTRRRRARGYPAATACHFSLAEVGAVVGTVPWVWMTMRPDPAGHRRVNAVPLHDLSSLDVAAIPVQIIGNLLVFAALGFFLPIRFAALASVSRIVLLAATCATVIEVLQFSLDIGRVSSVDDVLINAAGAGLAALMSRRWWRSRTRLAMSYSRVAR